MHVTNTEANIRHNISRNKTPGRPLSAAVLFLVFCGIFALLLCTSFFKPAARADDSGGNMVSAETAEPSAEPAVEPASVTESVQSGEVYVPVHYDTVIWHNIPLLDGKPGLSASKEKLTQRQFRFVSGNRTPLPGYVWGDCIPETEAVNDEYFSDTVFIGNSLEEGFMIYSGLTTADYFAAKSITVKNIYCEKVIKSGSGKLITIMDALGRKAYSKVYILLGLNEIDYDTDDFCRMYSDLIDAVRELQPKAEIYIQSLTPVTKAQSESGSIFNNDSIREYNKALTRLAADKKAHFVNIYEALEDGEGNLPVNSSHDGIHPYKKYYIQWCDYLRTYTVSEIRQ